VPLLEIDTDPNIPDSKTAKDVALYIGTLLRLTGMVQRGIGSIRQDVNLSIKDGARVEIKGVQELGLIDKFLDNEIMRQQNLITIKNKLLKADAKVGNAVNATNLFKNTYVEVIKPHVNTGAVFAIALTGFAGSLGFEINPNRRLGTEISDYAKMAGVHGIIHSDEDITKYKFKKDEIDALRKLLKISESGSFIIIAGKTEEAQRAAELAIWRAKYALVGVPKETRMAYDNDFYTSKFMRPLPSGSRMYPETDVKPILVTDEMKKSAVNNAPNVESERKYIKSLIKNDVLAEQLILSPRLQLFKIITERSKADPEFVANVLIQKLTELRRNGVNVDIIKDETMIDIFKFYATEKITKQAVEETLKLASKDNSSIESLLSKFSLLRIKGKELKAIVEGVKKSSKDIKTDDLRNSVMTKYRLNVDGSELNKILVKKK
jgi:glutamyl-tRNA(Gln) amidotransferase subunit E